MLATEQKIGEKEEPDAAVSKWPLPFNISLDKVELILKGYYRAGADQHPVSAADLASTTGLNALTIKANSKFLANIGWLKLVDRNQYTLTTSGTDFVKSLSSADGIGVANLIRIAIEKSPLQDLLNFIDLRGKDQLSYDQLFNHVKTMARLPENPKYPRGIAAPISPESILSSTYSSREEFSRQKPAGRRPNRPAQAVQSMMVGLRSPGHRRHQPETSRGPRLLNHWTRISFNYDPTTSCSESEKPQPP